MRSLIHFTMHFDFSPLCVRSLLSSRLTSGSDNKGNIQFAKVKTKKKKKIPNMATSLRLKN